MPPAKKEARSTDTKTKNPFEKISPDLHRVILSFLLDTNSTEYEYWNGSMKIDLAASACSLLEVSKSWSSCSVKLINQQAPTEFVSPEELAAIKYRARMLDLTVVRRNFIKDAKEKWGHLSIYDEVRDEEIGCLDYVLRDSEFDLNPGDKYKRFAEKICEEYRDFLVVKSLELMAAKKQPEYEEGEEPNTIALYKEKCMPPKVVDVFWRTHMLVPKKYAEDCTFLIGATIDHEAGYVSPKQHCASGYKSKKKNLFRFEILMPGYSFAYLCKRRLCDAFEGDIETHVREKLDPRRVHNMDTATILAIIFQHDEE